MENEKHLNEKIHEKLSNWQSKLDHFELQLSLGKMEAADEFQKQKKVMHDYLHNYIQIGSQLKETTKEKAEEIKKVLSSYKDKLAAEENATKLVIAKHKEEISDLSKKIKDL